MQLTFYGAAGFVTGSCHVLTLSNGKKVMIDCGMYQGTRDVSRRSYEPFHFNPKEIDAVILTHAHLDHCGLLPKLAKYGYRGPIYCTPATADLAKVVLEDSAHLQQFENKWDNKRLKRQGKPLRKPLYGMQDAKRVFTMFRGKKYNTTNTLFPGVTFTFKDAGHIVGSAMVELFAEGKKIVFSGDIGQQDAPIIRDPTLIPEGDVVLCESTYGSRTHEDKKERTQLLLQAIRDANRKKGKLLIPSFAIERTQELVYALHKLVDKALIPKIPIFVDSPMATKATRVFVKHTETYDQETMQELHKGHNPFAFPTLTYTERTEESKALNDLQGPAVIIASSGMCTGGRIKHHLKHHLPDPSTIVLFIGYQGRGTLGRRIRQGNKVVKIYGQPIPVHAEVRSIGGFSAHADQPQLLRWLHAFKTNPKVFYVHGEPDEAKALKQAYGSGTVARLDQTVQLS